MKYINVAHGMVGFIMAEISSMNVQALGWLWKKSGVWTVQKKPLMQQFFKSDFRFFLKYGISVIFW